MTPPMANGPQRNNIYVQGLARSAQQFAYLQQVDPKVVLDDMRKGIEERNPQNKEELLDYIDAAEELLPSEKATHRQFTMEIDDIVDRTSSVVNKHVTDKRARDLHDPGSLN